MVSDTTMARLAPATRSECVLVGPMPPSMQMRSPIHVGPKIPGSDMLAETACEMCTLEADDTTSRCPL